MPLKTALDLKKVGGGHGVTCLWIPLPLETADCGGDGRERFRRAIQAAVMNVAQGVQVKFREIPEYGACNLLPRFHAGYIHALTFQKSANMGDIGHEFFCLVAFGHVNQDGSLFLVVQVKGFGDGYRIAPGCWFRLVRFVCFHGLIILTELPEIFTFRRTAKRLQVRASGSARMVGDMSNSIKNLVGTT